MDLKLADGRTLHCYDSGDAGGLTVFWHHGSPNTGMPPEPLFPAAADQAALRGDWAWMARIAGMAIDGGPDGYIDDGLGDVRPWGFEPGQVTVPVLVFHGGQDRIVPSAHGAWLAARCPDTELWLRPDDGHVSVLGSCGVAALDWLVAHA